MAAYRIYLTGAHLLLLSHVAHSFILLTANMEDVKKIARKFVSDSLAEQIAGYVAKATEQMVSNVSEENDKNADEFQNMSADDAKLRNQGRQRYQKATRTNKDSDLNNIKVTTKNNFVEAYQKRTTRQDWTTEDNLIAAKDISWEKEENINSVQKYSREVKQKTKNDFEQQEQYEHSKFDFDLSQQPKIEYEKTKVQYEHQKPKNEQPNVEYEQQQPEYEPKPQTVQKKIQNKPKQEKDRLKPEYDQLIQDDQQPKPEYEQLKPDYEQPEPDYDLPKPDENQSKVSYEQTKHISKPKKQRLRNKKTNLKSKPSAKKDQDILRPDQKLYKWKQTTTQKAMVESTVLYNEGSDEARHIRPPKRQNPLSRGFQLTGAKYKEPVQDIKENLTAPLQPAVRGFDSKLTTKKERTEFDQYDNPNYPKQPKIEMLATSGPIVLPKVPLMEPWWNKELPEDKLNKKSEVMTII